MNRSPEIQRALYEVHQRLQDLYGDRLVRVVLYGSQARGDARPNSDVDVLVVLKGPIRVIEEIKRLTPLKLNMLENFDLYFSLQPISEEAYEDRARPLMMNVHAEGIEL